MLHSVDFFYKHHMGAIRILELIRWGMGKKGWEPLL